jgi:DNA-binding transcriptional regulator/RsmH inhibitor MraZ
MEYEGILTRKIDNKRRFVWPAKWNDETEKFFFIHDEYDKIYPYKEWKKIMLSCKSDKEKVEWAEKSTELIIDSAKRLTLPKSCTWESIDLIGVIDYVIIRESSV